MKRMNQDNISDELLRLAAKQFAENKGKEYYKEAVELNNQDSDIPSEAQLRKFRKICAREFRKKNRKVKVRYKVAAVVAVALLAFNISVVSVPAMRQFVTNFLIQIMDTHSEIKISDEEAKERQENLKNNKYRIKFDKEYQMTYLPKGYFVIREKRDPASLEYVYENEEEKQIIFEQYLDSAVMNVDTEGVKVEHTNIKGNKAVIYIKDGNVAIIWRVKGYFLKITAESISRDKIIKIANSVE